MATLIGALEMTYRLPDVFSRNRNEESKEDNWADFVVPPFLNDLRINSQRKSLVIMGGRGCGKTTLLRYFCHATQFSPKRSELNNNDLSHIGLYWRADTNFLNSFVGGEQTPEAWKAAFEHLLACEFGKEIIRSLHSINCNPERQQKFGMLSSLDLRIVQDFDETLGNTLTDLDKSLQRSRIKLATWINNLDSYPKPIFLPVESFLRTLISTLKEQLPYLSESIFAVFIDEYENLRDEQQRFINGLLKHGSPPLIYNIAMKRNGWSTKNTIGPESIQDISDYRVINLENELAEDFDLFAAELLFFRLAEHEPDLLDKLPIVPDKLRSIEYVDQRYKNKEYHDKVIKAAEKLLPRVGERDAAHQILSDTKLREKLLIKTKESLKKRDSILNSESFIDDRFPEVSVLMPALISRSRECPDKLLEEFNAMKSGTENRLAINRPLIQNNLFGCVNAIYIDAQRDSILFSGFTALTLIARGNIRHLLELIHRIFKVYEVKEVKEVNVLPVVPPDIQVKAIKDASASILSTVNGHGIYGPQLYSLAQCLGSIFRELHRSDRQSEPEINHFTIQGGEISSKLREYLIDAEKWSVLFVTDETKMKSTGAISSDYILNPIFSPYFQISFRKKRSMQVTTTQLLDMLEGDQFKRDKLVKELGGRERDVSENGDLFGEQES